MPTRRCLAIIQARLGSSRFPRKALADLHGKPVLQHVIDRVSLTEGVSHVVVACPPSDLAAFRAALVETTLCAPDVPEDDVLSRYCGGGIYAHYPTIMRVTGDCPLWDPRIAEAVLAEHWDGDRLYTSNVRGSYQDGTDVEVFDFELLRLADDHTHGAEREHVTPWMRRVTGYYDLPLVHIGDKLSIDTPEDLERVRRML